MKRKIFLFNLILLIYIANLTISDGQVFADSLPDGAIARFSPGALVYTVAFSPDGKFLASGGDDNAVILWDVADESEHEAFIEHGKPVTSVAFSLDGKLLASTSLDGYVRLWHVSSESRRISLRHGGWVESVAFSPDGKTLVSGGGDQEGTLILWNVPQKRDIATFSQHEGPIESIAFSPDGQMLASASRDRTIKLWDIDSQHMRKTLSGHSNVVHAVAFSPDGETLASSSRDNTIKLWKVSSGENLATFEIQNNLYVYAEAIAFSPDGQFLASACVDYTVKLWDIVNHRKVATLTGHHGGVTSVAFSPDGRTLASGSRDRTVLLWDLAYFGFKPQLQDTMPPEIVIHSSMEHIVKATVREAPVKVNVTDDSRIADVWINGREASVLEVGVFNGTVPLNHGENEIRIIATDVHSNMGTHRFTIVREKSDRIDRIPPEIVIHSPTSRSLSVTAKQFTIEGSVIDDEGIAEVWVNDVKVVVSEADEFTATILLDFGENEIHVIATDTHGNIDTNTLTVHREDTEGPEIQIISPEYSDQRGLQPIINLLAESVLVSGTVTDPSGVAEVKVNNIEVEIRGDRFELTVPLTHGNNFIRVTATDIPSNLASKEITIFRPQPPPPLPDPIVPIGRNYALLFAVDTYDHWPKLRYPHFDAINIKQDLEDIYGFEVELIQNPAKADILRELHKYAQKEYAPEDQLLIFFAGHGDFDTVTNMGYIVSQDTKKPQDDIVRLSYFSHSYFRDIIDRMSCKHIFLVMDTCYSGTFDERLAMRGEAENLTEMLSSEDIKRKLTYTTRWYLTSGAKEKVPDDSLFVRALLEALRSKGGSDNVLTIKEILTYLEDLSDPTPCFDEFGRNAPGSDFLFIAK
ncbi:MAG: caspase family protein [Candidatus Poribacteria bacterium]|nr:caspase family protein [Candidatus Poribacteria bacterium]